MRKLGALATTAAFLWAMGMIVLIAHAATIRDVTVTWDYDNPPTDLAGFEVRLNGDDAGIVSVGPEARSWSSTMTMLDDDNIIELRAKDTGGQTSEWANAHYDPVPNDPILELIVARPPD